MKHDVSVRSSLAVALLCAAACAGEYGHLAGVVPVWPHQPCDPSEAAVCTLAPSDFPENGDIPDLAHLRDRDIGIAFSGGGARAATAALGQLRALAALRWGDDTPGKIAERDDGSWAARVKYISGVSGGSWAALAYTFVPAGVLDQNFLGEPYNVLAERPADTLKSRPNGLFLLAVARGGNVNQRFAKYFESARNRAWARTIGDAYLRPLGLDPESWFAVGPEHRAALQALTLSVAGRTTTVPASAIAIPKPGRPFLIVGATTLTQSKLRESDDTEILPLELTPLYAGIRGWFDPYDGDWLLGGGYRATIALDALVIGGPDSGGPRTQVSIANHSQRRTTLSDLAGIAGSAAVETISRLPLIDAESVGFRSVAFRTADNHPAPGTRAHSSTDKAPISKPEESEKAGGKQDSELSPENLVVGDGEHLDNLGLLPLLARGVPKIIVFVNTTRSLFSSTALDDLEVLFSSHTRKRKGAVFEERSLVTVLGGLRDNVRVGPKLPVFCSPLPVVPNALFIRPYSPTICWVYLFRTPGFLEELSTNPHDDVREIAELARAARDGSDSRSGRNFVNFPYYNTAFQEGLQLLDLDTAPANLLADLTTWTLFRGAPLISAAFAAHPNGPQLSPGPTGGEP